MISEEGCVLGKEVEEVLFWVVSMWEGFLWGLSGRIRGWGWRCVVCGRRGEGGGKGLEVWVEVLFFWFLGISKVLEWFR